MAWQNVREIGADLRDRLAKASGAERAKMALVAVRDARGTLVYLSTPEAVAACEVLGALEAALASTGA